MGVLSALCLCATFKQYPQRADEGIRSPGTRVIDCKPPCGFWDSNPGSLEEQPVLLAAKPVPNLTFINGPLPFSWLKHRVIYLSLSFPIYEIVAARNMTLKIMKTK